MRNCDWWSDKILIKKLCFFYWIRMRCSLGIKRRFLGEITWIMLPCRRIYKVGDLNSNVIAVKHEAYSMISSDLYFMKIIITRRCRTFRIIITRFYHTVLIHLIIITIRMRRGMRSVHTLHISFKCFMFPWMINK